MWCGTRYRAMSSWDIINVNFLAWHSWQQTSAVSISLVPSFFRLSIRKVLTVVSCYCYLRSVILGWSEWRHCVESLQTRQDSDRRVGHEDRADRHRQELEGMTVVTGSAPLIWDWMPSAIGKSWLMQLVLLASRVSAVRERAVKGTMEVQAKMCESWWLLEMHLVAHSNATWRWRNEVIWRFESISWSALRLIGAMTAPGTEVIMMKKVEYDRRESHNVYTGRSSDCNFTHFSAIEEGTRKV